jgi:hypothetical protein
MCLLTRKPARGAGVFPALLLSFLTGANNGGELTE